MPDDLPNIDPNLDAPLPNVPANSDLVPYRLSRTDPGGQPVVTTGYGPRGRAPIQPPGGGGAGFPDMDRIANAAFSNLPVDQAVKAVEAASRYLGQRGYQRDLASGTNPAQALVKWGPMMFRQATGIPEAIERTVPPPITPQQMIQNRLNQQKFDAAQVAAKAKADREKAKDALAARKLHVLSSGEIIQETGNPDDPVKVIREKSQGSGADKDIDYQIKAQNLLPLKANELPTDPSYQSRTNLAAQIQQRHPIKTEPTQASTQPASPYKEGQIVKNKKDGKRYKIVNGEPVLLKE